MPNPEMSPGGEVVVDVADSFMATTAEDGSNAKFEGYVLLIHEILSDDLDAPVRRIAYRADPEQARMIATRINDLADELEGKT